MAAAHLFPPVQGTLYSSVAWTSVQHLFFQLQRIKKKYYLVIGQVSEYKKLFILFPRVTVSVDLFLKMANGTQINILRKLRLSVTR